MGGNQFREEGDRHLCLAPRQLLVKSITVGHIFTSTKHAKSLRAQIEAARRSVLSQFFSHRANFWWWWRGKAQSSPIWLVLPLLTLCVQNTGSPLGPPASQNKLWSWTRCSIYFSCNGNGIQFVWLTLFLWLLLYHFIVESALTKTVCELLSSSETHPLLLYASIFPTFLAVATSWAVSPPLRASLIGGLNSGTEWRLRARILLLPGFFQSQ